MPYIYTYIYMCACCKDTYNYIAIYIYIYIDLCPDGVQLEMWSLVKGSKAQEAPLDLGLRLALTPPDFQANVSEA